MPTGGSMAKAKGKPREWAYSSNSKNGSNSFTWRGKTTNTGGGW